MKKHKPAKKDSSDKNGPDKKKVDSKPIGAAAEEPKKKKGFLKKIFGKKDKE